MPTHCSPTGMAFGRAGGRELVAAFDGGRVTSEAGALLLGATVILTSSDDAKLARGRALGADHLVNYRTELDWSRPVKALTEGRPASLMDWGASGSLNG